MKKRNLLTLTALCMSLGLVVTACQGSAGEKGDQGPVGPEGPAGEKGDKGDKGEDGKTYQAVIVQDCNVDGGKVIQDKYFIEPGEKVTLTFEPSEGNDIITNFEVNGVEIEVEPDATTYVIESTEADMGFQITSAKFTNLLDYSKEAVLNHYKDLSASDTELAGVTVLENGTLEANTTLCKTSYQDSSVFNVAKDGYDSLGTFVNGLDEDTAVTARLALVKAEVERLNSLVDDKYLEVITAVKTTAKAQADTKLSEVVSVTSTTGKYTKTTDLEAAKTAIDEATSLVDIAKIIRHASDSTTDALKGSVDKLADGKKAAYNEISTALTAVTDAQEGLADETSAAKIKKDLEELGVTVGQLPTEIATAYYAKIQEATEIEWTSNNSNTVLGKEGADLITNSLTSVYKEVKNAVLKIYLDEVEASEYLNEEGNSTIKSRVISTLTTTANEWFNAATKTATTQREVYFSFDLTADHPFKLGNVNGVVALEDFYSVTSKDLGSTSLRGALESSLESTLSDQLYVVERLNKVKDSAKTELEAAISAILANDADYKAATAITSIAGDTANVKVLAKVGLTGAQVENPFFNVNGLTAGEDGLVTIDASESFRKNITGTIVGTGVNTYGDISYYYNEIAEDEIDGKTKASDVLVAKEKIADNIDTIYAAARHNYAGIQKDTIEITTGTYIDADRLKESFKDNVYGANKTETAANLVTKGTTMSNISTYVGNAKNNIAVLEGLDESLVTFLNGLNDQDYVDEFNSTTSSSTLREEFDDLLNGLLDGTKVKEDAVTFVAGLPDAYKAEVAQILSETISSFNEAVQNLKIGQIAVIIRALEAKRTELLALLGKDGATDNASTGFKNNNVSSINRWLAYSVATVKNVAGNETAVPTYSVGGANVTTVGTFDNDGGKANYANNSSVYFEVVDVSDNRTHVKVHGNTTKMSAEQVKAWTGDPNSAITNMEYITIAYKTNYTGAASRKVGWSEDGEVFATESTRELPASGLQETILGLKGEASVRGEKKYYLVQILDESNQPIHTYVFDFASVID